MTTSVTPTGTPWKDDIGRVGLVSIASGLFDHFFYNQHQDYIKTVNLEKVSKDSSISI